MIVQVIKHLGSHQSRTVCTLIHGAGGTTSSASGVLLLGINLRHGVVLSDTMDVGGGSRTGNSGFAPVICRMEVCDGCKQGW